MVHNKKFIYILILYFLIANTLIQTCFAHSDILKYGIQNPSVSKLQTNLKLLGFMTINPTGYFGNITKSAVIKFQKRYGLVPDGIAGTLTLTKINKLLGISNTISRSNLDRTNTLALTNITKQWISGLPQTPYNNGVGKYEGVVLHYTSNTYNSKDTAQIEANYTREHWDNAFVHEFIDSKQVIQIANPDYTSWGAGKYANHKFVQIELCRADTTENFNKSFETYCQRAAEYLYARKLGVTPAKSDGSGTLWRHSDVSNYLGETDHSDPNTYLAKWGKSWQDTTDAVTKYYNLLESNDKNN